MNPPTKAFLAASQNLKKAIAAVFSTLADNKRFVAAVAGDAKQYHVQSVLRALSFDSIRISAGDSSFRLTLNTYRGRGRAARRDVYEIPLSIVSDPSARGKWVEKYCADEEAESIQNDVWEEVRSRRHVKRLSRMSLDRRNAIHQAANNQLKK